MLRKSVLQELDGTFAAELYRFVVAADACRESLHTLLLLLLLLMLALLLLAQYHCSAPLTDGCCVCAGCGTSRLMRWLRG